MGKTHVQERAGNDARQSVQSARNKPQPLQGQQLVGQEYDPDNNDKNQDSSQLAANFTGVACTVSLQSVGIQVILFSLVNYGPPMTGN